MSKETERVATGEIRNFDAGVEMRVFKKVEIKYADGETFYSGWIQDFGSVLTGPTFFEENYTNYSLEKETVTRREKYWEPVTITEGNAKIRIATPSDLDALIDLNFHNYFDGGYNRISSYQGLNFLIDETHEFLVYTINEEIFGFLYICWNLDDNAIHSYFDSLYVAPCIRGKGIGSALIGAGVERANKKNCVWIDGRIIGSSQHCEHIAQLLAPHGFKVKDVRPRSARWTEVDMQLPL